MTITGLDLVPIHSTYGAWVGHEWRLGRLSNGEDARHVEILRTTTAFRDEKVARKHAERLNQRYGATYQRYVAVRVDLRVHKVD